MTQQPVILAGDEAGLVGPVLEDVTPRQQLIQPGGIVVAEAAEQHQVGVLGIFRPNATFRLLSD